MGEKVYFSIVVDGKEDAAKRCSLRKNGGPKDVLCVGRYGKNHIVVDHPSVSNKHLELKLGPAPEFQLQVRDLSANGSGIQQPSGETDRLIKEKTTPVEDGVVLVLPLQNKKGEGAEVRHTIYVRQEDRSKAGQKDAQTSAGEKRKLELEKKDAPPEKKVKRDDSKDKDKDKEKDKAKEKEKEKTKEKDKAKEKEKDREKQREKDREKDREKAREKASTCARRTGAKQARRAPRRALAR